MRTRLVRALREDREVPTSLKPLGLGRLEPRTATSPPSLWVRGAIIAGSGLAYGAVVIDKGRISRIAAADEPAPPDARVIETHGVVSPGFVDVHNHSAFAAFRRPAPSRTFRGRFDWRGRTRCGFIVNPNPDPIYRGILAAALELRERHWPRLIQYGLVRALVGGTTTTLVDADLDDEDLDSALFDGVLTDPRQGGPRILGLLDAPCLLGPALPAARAAVRAGAKLFVHVGEGVDDVSVGEFTTLVAKRLLTENTILIHGLALRPADWDLVTTARGGVVLSPVSSWNLYHLKPRVDALARSGLQVALGPDWTLSGSSTLLDELGFTARSFPEMDPVELLDMVTRVPAELFGRGDLGRIAPGACADLVVLGQLAPRDLREAARFVVNATIGEVRLVVLGGQPVFGKTELLSGFEGGEEVTLDTEACTLRRTLRISGTRVVALRALLDDAMQAAIPNGRVAPIWEPELEPAKGAPLG